VFLLEPARHSPAKRASEDTPAGCSQSSVIQNLIFRLSMYRMSSTAKIDLIFLELVENSAAYLSPAKSTVDDVSLGTDISVGVFLAVVL
jgi:hypothetical protein